MLTTKYLILFWKKNMQRVLENPDYAEIRHGGVILTQG